MRRGTLEEVLEACVRGCRRKSREEIADDVGVGYSHFCRMVNVFDDAVRFPAQWGQLDYEHAELDRNTICLFVHGDSMLPLARAGQCVLCSRERSLNDADLAAVGFKGKGPLFKRVYYNKERKEWILESVNTSDPKPPIIAKDEDLDYLYKVVGVLFE